MAVQGVDYGNWKLPFDVLGTIFRFFVDEESISYPLEALLLVCRAWHSAAIDHKSLWSIFHMQMASHDISFDFWEKCISRRLLRCPLGGFIDFQIDISDGADHRLAKVVSALAGESNVHVKQWRRFSIRAGRGHSNNFLGQYLCLDTPYLEEFELHNIYPGEQILLPHAPLLKRFHTSWFPAPYPNLRNVTEITIAAISRETADNNGILVADNVVTLCIEDWSHSFESYFRLPREFPALRHLSLQGRIDRDVLVGFFAPRLQTLALSLMEASNFGYVSRCRGIVPKNIEELKLGWCYDLEREDWINMISEIRSLIEAAVNIRILWIWNHGMARLALKLLEDLRNFQYHTFALRYAGEQMEVPSGEKRLLALAEFRVIVKVPSDSWYSLARDLNDDGDFDTFEGDSGDSRQLFGIYHSSVHNSTR